MPAPKDPLHAHVDRLMAERKLDALLLTGNTPESPSFWYLTRSQKLEAATLLWKRGGKKLLIVGDMERDNAAKTGLDWIARSKTPYTKLVRGAKKPGDAELAAERAVTRAIRAAWRSTGAPASRPP